MMTGRTRMGLIGAGIGVAALILTWAIALHVPVAERVDQSILDGFYNFRAHPRVSTLAARIAHLCNPKPYLYLAAVPVLATLVRRRPRMLLAVGTILLGANLTTELLKPLLAVARADSHLAASTSVGPGSWPSGHATAAMSLALTCVLAAPARLRPAVATVGAAFAVAVSYSFLALGWHYPSDVLGGFLIAGTWTMLSVAALSAAAARWPRRTAGSGERAERLSVREVLAPQGALIAGVLAVGGVVALVRPHPVISYAREHELFVLGAIAIGLIALAVASAITLATRR